MSLFAGGIGWPEELQLVFVGKDAKARNGKIREANGKYVVDVEPGLSFQQGWRGIDNSRVVTTIIDGEPAIVRGYSGGGVLHLSDARIGSDDLTQNYVAIRAKFELLASLSSIRHEDGPARSAGAEIALPPLERRGRWSSGSMLEASPTSVHLIPHRWRSLRLISRRYKT